MPYKCFTHDLRSPIQGGDPVWSGSLPYPLPRVAVDTSSSECAQGWNACGTAEDALRIGGFWPNGRPSRIFVVETDEPIIERGDKLRAATWTITQELGEEPIEEAIRTLSRTWFGDMAEEMAVEQLAWRRALARPERKPDLVEQHLALALDVRGLPWKLRRFESAWDARDARAARVAWDAWAARVAWDARDARDARDALTHFFAASKKWIKAPRDQYTVGIRDAYACGLEIAIPTGPGELGWA